MVNEMNYETLLFMSRDLKKKGTAAFGEWKLFQAKFNNAEDKTLKFSAFSNPKIGLSIEDLKEGESYTGAEGLSGENGINGIDGEDAEPCTVVGVLDEDTGDTGALITCPTSQAIVWDGVEGEDGSDAILEVIDPCGKELLMMKYCLDYLMVIYMLYMHTLKVINMK